MEKMEKNKAILRVLLITAIALLLNACASSPHKMREDVRKNIDATLDKARKSHQNKTPTDISRALLPPINVTRPGGKRQPLVTRFDVSINNASVRQVYLGLVEGTPYSVVIPPNLHGRVSLNLKNVTVAEAFDAIRRVYAFDYERKGNYFYVSPPGIQTRIYPVNYINLVRKGKSNTRVSGGDIGRMTSSGGGGSTTSGDDERRSSINVETKSTVDFWKDLHKTLVTIVGSKKGRFVVVNPQAGLVIVRAYPKELRVVQNFLGLTQNTINRQVILEAKIIEVELNDRFQTGINWSALRGGKLFGMGGGGSIFSGTGTSSIIGNTGNLNPTPGTFSPPATGTSAFGGVFTLSSQSSNFGSFIELLKGQGEVQVLSSPRVATVNNQKAVIKIGGDEFFVTGIQSNTTSTTGGTITETIPSVTLTSFFSGIVLDVTPQIDKDNNVILHIHPSVSTITQRNKTFVISDKAFDLPLAVSSIQESDSIVRTSSGRIIVIGGLMKIGTTDEAAGVPILGQVPVVGHLFKHKKITRIKKELIILLKPTVITTGGDWADDIGATHDRIKKISRDRRF
ncbi:MAG TPA: pilus (MSHA type) biogenesis protein MshL [Acidiferrobacteraceae bacterium]|nr:pilus (MSHA type) biogenesis protein MshL [Acidiferrobacteraceae bacterium]HEX20278.1 pilus (MSHA type) biogenesis protein MshL [Acidiferrobacteraceae bacterium]